MTSGCCLLMTRRAQGSSLATGTWASRRTAVPCFPNGWNHRLRPDCWRFLEWLRRQPVRSWGFPRARVWSSGWLTGRRQTRKVSGSCPSFLPEFTSERRGPEPGVPRLTRGPRTYGIVHRRNPGHLTSTTSSKCRTASFGLQWGPGCYTGTGRRGTPCSLDCCSSSDCLRLGSAAFAGSSSWIASALSTAFGSSEGSSGSRCTSSRLCRSSHI